MCLSPSGDSASRTRTRALDTSAAPDLPSSKGQPLSTSRAFSRATDCQLKCEFDGCTYEGTFPRRWELTRHITQKHSIRPGLFVCWAEGCVDRQPPRSFARPDKLTSHIKAVHTRDTVFIKCPVDRCNLGRCTLETLGVHIARAHQRCQVGLQVLNASTCKVRKCVLWRCGKHVKARDLPGHVAGHAKDDILAATTELEHEGLVVLPASGSPQEGYAKSGPVITVQCPLCKSTSENTDQFITHLWTRHLFLAGSGGADHLRTWKSALAKVTPKTDHHSIKGLLPWAVLEVFFKRETTKFFHCPACFLSFDDLLEGYYQTETQKAVKKAALAHHLTLLRPEAEVVAELYPHRMQILRLYPEFVSHPVFADFDQPQAGIASSSQEPSQFDRISFMEGVENHGFDAPF
jgi:uncharacterized C2H2 Zn-finger protein